MQSAENGNSEAKDFLFRYELFSKAAEILSKNGIDHENLELINFKEVHGLFNIEVKGIYRGNKPFFATIQYMNNRHYGNDGLVFISKGYKYRNGTMIYANHTKIYDRYMEISR